MCLHVLAWKPQIWSKFCSHHMMPVSSNAKYILCCAAKLCSKEKKSLSVSCFYYEEVFGPCVLVYICSPTMMIFFNRRSFLFLCYHSDNIFPCCICLPLFPTYEDDSKIETPCEAACSSALTFCRITVCQHSMCLWAWARQLSPEICAHACKRSNQITLQIWWGSSFWDM